jgi:hypothetical protein
MAKLKPHLLAAALGLLAFAAVAYVQDRVGRIPLIGDYLPGGNRT